MNSREEIMEILEAFDLTGSFRDAAELAGLHTEIGMLPPAEFETNYYRQNTPASLAGSQTSESL